MQEHVSVSERSLTAPLPLPDETVSQPQRLTAPLPGLYGDGTTLYRITVSHRGHWYAQVQEPDGSWTYQAQNVDLASLSAVSVSEHCTQPGCRLPQWHRQLCGIHHAADTVKQARTLPDNRQAPSSREVTSE